MTKHQKVKICQDLYKNETENYKREQLGIIVYLVLFVILFVLILYWFIVVFLLKTRLCLWLRLVCLL